MDAAPLPGRAEHARDGGLDALVCIRNDELHAPQTVPRQAAQEVAPERLSLRHADRHAEHLAPAVAVHAHCDGDRHRDDAAGLAHLQIGRVDPDVRPVAFDRPIEERLHADVDLLAEPADVALGDAGHPHGFHQIVHRAGRYALNIRLLDDRGQRLFGEPPRLEEAGEIASRPQLGDAQLDGACPRLPVALAVAITLGKAVAALLAIPGARLPTSRSISRCAAKPIISRREIGLGALSQQRLQVHRIVGHQGSPSVGCRNPNLSEDLRWPPVKLTRRYSACRWRAPGQLHCPSTYTTTRDTTGRWPRTPATGRGVSIRQRHAPAQPSRTPINSREWRCRKLSGAARRDWGVVCQTPGTLEIESADIASVQAFRELAPVFMAARLRCSSLTSALRALTQPVPSASASKTSSA
ncbi:MAG: hypothetical protein JWM75_1183 [Sphingomonas bacterium]|nr:hypothetical protein [Sphingomonas bacterium]